MRTRYTRGTPKHPSQEEASWLEPDRQPAEGGSDELRESLRCLKWGREVGLISDEAYEDGKVEVLASF